MKKSRLKLWHRIILVALAGTLPLLAVTLFVISESINKQIGFGLQEKKGDAYQRPVEQLLELLPRHEAAARRALAGDAAAKNEMSQLRQQIDRAFVKLSEAQTSLGKDLQFTDAALAEAKTENAKPSCVQAEWQSLKAAPLATAAGDDANSKLINDLRAVIAYCGNKSDLILDPELDSYYLCDITLGALPQTQQRLSDIVLQVGDWLRNGQAIANRNQIAVMAAMLQQDDQDRITGDAQTSLSEDKNFHGISPTLQQNLPPAVQKYTTANQAFLALLKQIIDGAKLPDANAFETAGWDARAASFALWDTGVNELDWLLDKRVSDFRHTRLLSYTGIAVALGLVSLVIWLIVQNLNRIMNALIGELAENSRQVASASEQINSAGQQLAEGASEQAASLEETSASLEEIASMTKRNAQTAASTKEFAQQTRRSAELGAQSTREMTQAMDAIKSASSEMRAAMEAIKSASSDVSKIIKTIDEIAFQTNILALNAAVEAARAGEAGMGFAVVADEVRNLAQRSAKAARETSSMIEAAIARSESGVRVNEKVRQAVDEVVAKSKGVADHLGEIVEKVHQMDDQIGQIAIASQEQSTGISQVTIAVSQMDKVTQGNAASAEESAAAAQELNSQATALNDCVIKLEALVRNGSFATVQDAVSTAPAPTAVFKDQAPPKRPVTTSHLRSHVQRAGAATKPPQHSETHTARSGSFDVSQISKAIGAHGRWKSRLVDAVHTGTCDTTPDRVEVDDACEFGKWLYSLDPAHQKSSHWTQVRALHATFHKEAAKVLRLALLGQKTEAEKSMDFGGAYANISADLTNAMKSWEHDSQHPREHEGFPMPEPKSAKRVVPASLPGSGDFRDF